jgi:ATP-dependent helicase HrpA
MADPRIEEIRNLLPQAMLHDWVRLGSRLVRLLRDHHHPDKHEAILLRLLDQARASVALRERRRLNVPTINFPEPLPITACKDEIVAAIRAHQVIVIAGETGSGKTTQLPKMCLEAGLGIEAKIGCTQPRRIAALSISQRIADELNVTWGREVGCKVRFDDRSSPDTYIKLMTDGILLAETQADPLLSEYNAIIIDEAHERSLNIDFLLGYLKLLLAKRPELKLIITSATIDIEAFSQAFNDAPVLEVSGRVYPVEVVYAPFEDASNEEWQPARSQAQSTGGPVEEMTYIDAAAQAACHVLNESSSGDVLIFMPSERDIRETAEQLNRIGGDGSDIIPLFGRLTAGEQQRVFASAAKRKVVVATNIAETSLTIPGIRYVIDSGLARISRYNPRTRTRRLPIEPISQSSANQRKGRCGRVQNGVCIRLYSEADFQDRAPFTQPEIQRANLAEVILRMMAFRLGDIESFPFINPPTPAAIQGGYKLLQELGALDENRQLTSLGSDLARLPIDPILGRMVLQAQREHATQELLIIASGLSIQDPRERPFEQKEAAAAAHKRFAAQGSDFLTLLNIWNAVHEQWEKLPTQNQRRKFCKAHFLSYIRMREWQDLYAQLHEALEELGTVKLNETNAAYEAVHRSILSGLLAHIARREARNLYLAAGNRKVALFPASTLFQRGEKTKRTKQTKPSDETSQTDNEIQKTINPSIQSVEPEWMVAGEFIETSQHFARTVAGIDPLWLIDLAPHLCRKTHHNPRWDPLAGQVLVDEKLTLFGLEIHTRKAAYGNINPKEATEIFIRSALVEELLFATEEDDADSSDAGARIEKTHRRKAGRFSRRQPSSHHGRDVRRVVAKPALSGAYQFLQHNRNVRQKIETWQTRARRHNLADLDQALFNFYFKRLENVSSIHELNRFLRDAANQASLHITEADLMGDMQLGYDTEAFPDAVTIEGNSIDVSYAYSPGEEHDGVTLQLDFHQAQALSPAAVEWSVPGLREAQIAELLRALPKSIRKQLMPLPEKVSEITRELCPGGGSLKDALCGFIRQRYGIAITPTSWPGDVLPQHLRPRIEILTKGDKPIAAGRDLAQLRTQLQQAKIAPATDSQEWAVLAQ